MGNIPLNYSNQITGVIIPESETIDVVFICEQDFSSTESEFYRKLGNNFYVHNRFPKRKEAIKNFLKEVYGDDKIFRWSTWDKSNADIVSETINNSNISNKYDVVCSLGCPVNLFEQEDVDSVCRLLRDDGILLFFAPFSIEKNPLMFHHLNLQENLDKPIPNCTDRPFYPVSRIPLQKYSLELWKR